MGLHPILYAVVMVLDLLQFLIIFYVILNLLIHFDVINRYNKFVSKIYEMFSSIVDPIFAKIRKFIPAVFGNVDLSPIVALLLLNVVQYAIYYYGAR